MKPTDYSRIAASYDKAAERHQIPADPHLGARLQASAGPFGVLDLACGTGNYLRVQQAAYPDARIAWHGLDASVDMLAHARAKVAGVTFEQGSADVLPYDDRSFDYLSCNFAFHHFLDKRAALREMSRVLKPSGALRFSNVDPARMRAWWGYRFFPEAWVIDEVRFWSAELLAHELRQLGFEPRLEVHVSILRRPALELLERARLRDMSSVDGVSEEGYAAGLAVLDALSARDAQVEYDEALLTCEALRVG